MKDNSPILQSAICKFSKLLLNIKKSREKIKDHYLLEKYRRIYLKNFPPKI